MDSAQFISFLRGDRVSFPDTKSTSLDYAQNLDSIDPLRHFRNEFLIPSKADLKDPHPEAKPVSEQNDPSDPCVYLCGNSLGLQPKRTRTLLNEELSIWATRGVTGHFNHPQLLPWVSAAEAVSMSMAKIVGALPSEVAVMGSLTENIHLLMASFYEPVGARTKIIIEGGAFPSDHYAVESQILWHGLDPEKELVCVQPKKGEFTLATQQILGVLDEHRDTAALLFLSGVQYYTGQAFDIKYITAYAQSKGITVGWDFAHAVGNIPLELHEWGVDFAAWCTYKYLSSGPGGMAGIFVHDKHEQEKRRRLAGWWGHDPETRFKMGNNFVPAHGAAGYQVSNPSIMSLTALRASLSVYTETSMTALRTKSVHLTGYLEHLLHASFPTPSAPFKIITPGNPQQRGAQLSLLFREGLILPVLRKLDEEGIIVDERKPDVIRIAPLPMYNSFEDCWRFVDALERAVVEVEQDGGTEVDRGVEAGATDCP